MNADKTVDAIILTLLGISATACCIGAMSRVMAGRRSWASRVEERREVPHESVR